MAHEFLVVRVAGLREALDTRALAELDRWRHAVVSDFKKIAPVRTGLLSRRAGDFIIKSGWNTRFVTPVPYASFVNRGTRFMDAQPFMFLAPGRRRELLFIVLRAHQRGVANLLRRKLKIKKLLNVKLTLKL